MKLSTLQARIGWIKKSSRPILKNVLVNDKGIFISDLETTFCIKNTFDLTYGLHSKDTLGMINPLEDNEEIAEYNEVLTYLKNERKYILDQVKNVSLETLQELMKHVSTDQTRLYLNGVAVNEGHLVATDGHTMHFSKINETENNYIIPSDGLKKLIALCKSYKVKTLNFELSEKHCEVKTEHFDCFMRLIQREFPKWKRVIPTKFDNVINDLQWPLDNKLINALFKKNTIAFPGRITNIDGQIVIIPSENKDKQFILGQCDKDFKFELGFNAQYLNKSIGKSEKWSLKFNGTLNPAMVNESIVMPLKL